MKVLSRVDVRSRSDQESLVAGRRALDLRAHVARPHQSRSEQQTSRCFRAKKAPVPTTIVGRRTRAAILKLLLIIAKSASTKRKTEEATLSVLGGRNNC